MPKPHAPRVTKWTDLTSDPAAPRIVPPRQQAIEFLEQQLSGAGVLPIGCRIEVEWLMFDSKEAEKFRIKVRREKQGYTYLFSCTKEELSYDRLHNRRLEPGVLARLRDEADILAQRVWYCEGPPLKLVP